MLQYYFISIILQCKQWIHFFVDSLFASIPQIPCSWPVQNLLQYSVFWRWDSKCILCIYHVLFCISFFFFIHLNDCKYIHCNGRIWAYCQRILPSHSVICRPFQHGIPHAEAENSQHERGWFSTRELPDLWTFVGQMCI